MFNDGELDLNEEDMAFFNNHCKLSRHTLQISKCFENDCGHCSSHPVRSNMFVLLKSRFVPPPCKLRRNVESGELEIADPWNSKQGDKWANLWIPTSLRLTIPNLHCDTFNGELNEAELKSLICNCCNAQFGSKKMMTLHERSAHSGHKDVIFICIYFFLYHNLITQT